MHTDLTALEAKREELEAKIAAARIRKDFVAVNNLSGMLCDCNAYICQAMACDEVKRQNKLEVG